MIPEEQLSSTAVPATFLGSAARPDPLEDYELGGVALNDPSEGLQTKLWTLKYDKLTGNVYTFAPAVPPTVLFTRPDITELALAFDQNMNPFVAFVQAGVSKFWWYDTLLSMQVFDETTLAGCQSPRCCLDDKRTNFAESSDIILAYMRGGSLYYRQQRERYTVERLLRAGIGGRLLDVGMNRQNRLQFLLRDATDPSVVGGKPSLADVVLALALKAGVRPDEIDVSELFNDSVDGLPVQLEQGLDKPIDWLREMYFFDKAEYDKKLRFPKRGRDIVERIPYVHLVQGAPTALKTEEHDVAKLPRKVHINHLDPDAGHAPNKQTAQRRTNLGQSREEKRIDTKVVATVDFAASAALTKLKTYWNGARSYEFTTTRRYANLTVTDVIEVEDAKGVWHRVMLVERNEDGNELQWKAELDGGERTYGSLISGNGLPPPTSTTPGLVGETRLELLNIPVLKDVDDEPGLYIAGAGASSAWQGYQLLLSTDEGNSYSEAFLSETPCVIGDTETDLQDEVSAQYPAQQTLDVVVNYPLASVSAAQLQAGLNRAVVGDELIQFQTATLLATLPNGYRYRLSGLVRGRKDTAVEFWPLGTRFVLIDESVIFARAERWMVGLDLYYKPVSIGATADETTPTAYLFDEVASQREWAPHQLEAVRDGSDNVSVSFIGRGRLGTSRNPYNSKYFQGYRIKFDDGFTVDTNEQSYVRASTPPGVTITVCALNEITGEGPATAGVTV